MSRAHYTNDVPSRQNPTSKAINAQTRRPHDAPPPPPPTFSIAPQLLRAAIYAPLVLSLAQRVYAANSTNITEPAPEESAAEKLSSDGDDFSNNLFSDLAPLLTLFGEQVTKQYMAGSMSWVDNITLATAPLGILTILVSAVRVSGAPWLRAIIGRAREAKGVAEAELLSSTSGNVCELWSGEGVVRVMGTPKMAELIYVAGAEGEACVYSLEQAAERRLYRLRSQHGPKVVQAQGEQAPNIALNVGGALVPAWELWVYAIVGIVLQIGVLGFSGATVSDRYADSYPKGGGKVPPYAFPFFVAGTTVVCVGIMLCSRVVEGVTTEEIWEPDPKYENLRVIRLQKGGQVVNDQMFGPYALLDLDPEHKIRTSRHNTNSFRFTVSAATVLTLLGYIVQFIALRGLHWSSTIAQLVATFTMTTLRSVARRGLSKDPKAEELPLGFELEWTALHIAECETWEARTGLICTTQYGSSPEPGTKLGFPRARRVADIRIRLSALTLWEPYQHGGYPLGVTVLDAVEASMNYIFSSGNFMIKTQYTEWSEFTWHICVDDGQSVEKVPLVLRRHREEDHSWSKWTGVLSEVDAVLSLWMHSIEQKDKGNQLYSCNQALVRMQTDYFTSPVSGMSSIQAPPASTAGPREHEGVLKLLGLATDERVMAYEQFIYRETKHIQVHPQIDAATGERFLELEGQVFPDHKVMGFESVQGEPVQIPQPMSPITAKPPNVPTTPNDDDVVIDIGVKRAKQVKFVSKTDELPRHTLHRVATSNTQTAAILAVPVNAPMPRIVANEMFSIFMWCVVHAIDVEQTRASKSFKGISRVNSIDPDGPMPVSAPTDYEDSYTSKQLTGLANVVQRTSLAKTPEEALMSIVPPFGEFGLLPTVKLFI
ncbi:hypothetical protein EDC01DRAFT_682457 [Geopyxis carbonaria]|nr:hypothetical protein EDC01DRAFT_682457 [Geopyxis carbonaria]